MGNNDLWISRRTFTIDTAKEKMGGGRRKRVVKKRKSRRPGVERQNPLPGPLLNLRSELRRLRGFLVKKGDHLVF